LWRVPTSATPPEAPSYPPELSEKLAAALTRRRALPGGYRPRTHHLVGADPKYTNRLILESSPYLLQHAHNPVDWRPWGDEAFEEARRLGRPVFLSVGYATCHWCHVMEGESFEDEEIAGFLNSHYIAIKVDREERPDVDAVYMAAVQALTQSGGWPMSVWLTPDREPFYGGTYFPPRAGARGAQIGFLEILRDIHATYLRDGGRVGQAASALVQAVKAQMEPAAQGTEATRPGTALVDQAMGVYRRLFDDTNGGLRRAPKFPSNVPVRLLLRAHRRLGDPALLQMATLTLEKMAAGGMYDQLGGGFHRYSTDAVWLVPHFEKMLYDNALLMVAYAEAFQATGRADFARVTRETADYLLREMASPEGAFYSATDADSATPEGHQEEGAFFVWSKREIEEVLAARGPDETARFIAHYSVTDEGNFEGANILHVARPSEKEWAALAEARAALYAVRSRRPPPLRDEKILAAWNGLAISGLAVAGRVLDEPRYVAAAARAASFVLGTLRVEGRLARSWKEGRAGAPGFLEDHAFVTAGLLDLFEATAERRWLDAALEVAGETERLFGDTEVGGWFMTAADHERLIAREKPAYDGAEPSGTSVALLSALRLHTLTTDDRWRAVAERAFASLAGALSENPLALAEALLAVEYAAARPKEIALVWRPGTEASAAPLLQVLRAAFVPHRVLIATDTDTAAALAAPVPWLADKPAQDDRPTAYVCVHGRCELPAQDAAALIERLAAP
jgi:uncharacterized protein